MTGRDLPPMPAFLLRPAPARAAQPSPARGRIGRGRDWYMPPPAFGPTLRAIKRGNNTFQKLRKSLGRRFGDREIRDALAALRRSGEITMTGRTYRAITTKGHPAT